MRCSRCLISQRKHRLLEQVVDSTKLLHTTASYCKVKSPDVCLSPDKKMIMCWHPEPEFPYEDSMPLPRDNTELTEGESVLKVQYLVEEKLKNRPDGPTDNELTQLFYTSKDYFKTRHRTEKRVKMRKFHPKDRDGL
ncbi:39S ribosomal protein L42, mitochondrial [Aplysia californica]|uniref:Large ribosomal subunit protein mL42 n=1 Tax=Aplysia californica TaxID=6500 RepID=A0ABM0JNH6_APLCA|nr:39S ribosomal protein L42, mitochondrial [Aplysia californica]